MKNYLLMKSKKIPTYLKYYLSKTRLNGLVFNKTYLENLSGINFYLDHSIEDKIKINFKASESTQNSTTEGKNKCSVKEFTSTSNSRIVSKNTVEGDEVKGIPVNSGTEYTASFDISSLPNSDYRIQLIISSDSTIAQGRDVTNAIRTVPITCNSLQRYSVSSGSLSQSGYLYIRCVPSGFTLDNIQVEEGSASEYEPYTGVGPSPDHPQDIHVVKGDNEVDVFNKNLYSYNSTQTINGITLTNNDNKSIDLSGTNTGARFNFGVTNIPIENIDRTKTYKFISNMPTNKFSLSVAEYNGTTWVRTLGSLNEGKNEIEVTPSSDTSITKIGIALFIDANATLDISNLRFAFVEKLQNYPLSLGTLEMCNINNYADVFFKNVPECEYYDNTLEEGMWYKYGRIGKVVLDGSENWKYTNNVFYINGFLRFVKGQPALSNYFRYGGSATNTTTAYQNGNNTISFNVDDGSSIYIRNDSITNINDWLSTHNTEVYYVLETPTKTLLTDTLQEELDNIKNNAHTYNKITNINQINEDRPFILDISYYRKIK